MKTSTWAGAGAVLLALVAVVILIGVDQNGRLAQSVTAVSGAVPDTPTLVAEPGQEPQPATTLRVPEASPWAPGTSITITDHAPVPGEVVQVGHCTVAYSFTTPETSWAVTAAHCGSPGDLVWATNDGAEVDFSAPVGHFTYSGLYGAESSELDVGIIEITDPARWMSAPDPAAPTLLADRVDDLPAQVCKYGTTTGHTCGEPLLSHTRELLVNDDGVEVTAVAGTARVCARAGDSGGPVYANVGEQRVIVGLVSGTRDAITGTGCEGPDAGEMTMSYTPMPRIQDLVDRVVPGAQFETRML
ncbi:trypsin-like serine protease [Corynebacterium halotolerans]|uniref:Peptidase S1 domain-containing protein n=1 Tax=Corynebacterium halotolerans YIM 70093 = DSM 44683 TaxID=1121362 RepID=M1P8I9_9CORY|nr:trypsin-like serine protease [Corynebacterium halotolerans]AGF72971.1 hypothetical protein A605_09845 [Corynebacterium halotolerans YIM 70093 = DSM 44683]